jgi:predicted nuclease of predicted toxin-antitoxin system
VKIRFLADNDLRSAIVKGVRRCERSVDFQSAQEAGLDGLTDLEVLAVAADAGRILVSHDWTTMPVHFREFVRGRRSPGVFLIAQKLPIGDAIEELFLGWLVTEAEEWENQLVRLPRWESETAGV